jgi:hypothetical protein
MSDTFEIEWRFTPWPHHIVADGDTFESIGQEPQISGEILARLNPDAHEEGHPENIIIGARVDIPVLVDRSIPRENYMWMFNSNGELIAKDVRNWPGWSIIVELPIAENVFDYDDGRYYISELV